jgi:tyrosinase
MSNQRKEIRSSKELGDAFVEGVRRLKEEVEDDRSVYDRFVTDHADASSKTAFDSSADATYPTDRGLIYHGPASLPWNRHFLLRFEQEMRRVLEKDTFRLPYWDWTTSDAGKSPWPEDVLGGDGREVDGEMIEVPFAITKAGKQLWTIVNRNGRPAGRLRRRRSGRNGELGLPEVTPVAEQTCYDDHPYNRASSSGVRVTLERVLFKVHEWVGGTMLTPCAVNDPAFFLIHSNIDRLWQRWQLEHEDRDDVQYVADKDCPMWHKRGDWVYPWLRHAKLGDSLAPVPDLYDESTLKAAEPSPPPPPAPVAE